MKNIFVHTGNNGDILFSLNFVKELHENLNISLDEFFIQTNVEMKYAQMHPNGNVGMTEGAAKFIKPLLEYTKLFRKVSYGDKIPDDGNIINLSTFRKMTINFQAGNIQSWYYQLISEHLPQDYSKANIIINQEDIDYRFKDKIIISKTSRYNNVFVNWKCLDDFKDKFMFIGLEQEHQDFCNNYFDVSYYKVNDMLELAKILAGCKGMIGNAGGNFSLAEVMKIPRVLVSCEFINFRNMTVPGPCNNQLCGGWFEYATNNQKLINSTKNLINL